MCLQHTGISFTESAKSVNCLFLLYKENLYRTPVGVSLLTIRVFIPPFTFLFLKVHLCTFFLIFLSQELDLKLLA